ncbi:N-methyl-L-tryptophan oxidase [Ammoniphilus sp. 3BR4]|uniref:N-methyl-L-tryptophan oxidase n=1 Tax=Ammoniphilus sp. 3BR4 TaxID=3158265 RepID=UPI0034677171
MNADVGIIGIGTMGSMALWQLARKGISVIGFEQFGTGHDRSAAGGETRLFRTAYKEGSEYVPILKSAYQQWRELESETGKNLLTINGGLAIGDSDSDKMKRIIDCIEKFDLGHEILTTKEAKERFPQHRLLPNEIMIVDKQAGFLRPENAIVTATQRAEELGAKVYRHTCAEDIQVHSDGVTVRTNGKDYKFQQVIITTGPWAGEFLYDYKQDIEVRRLLSTWFIAKDINLFSPEKFPIFQRETNGVDYYGTPSMDKSMVKISLSSREIDKIMGPNQLDRNVDLESLSVVRQIVEKDLPDLFPDPVRVSAHMEAYTTDKHAIVGRLPENNRIIAASGFSGHGFKMAPAIGKLIADIISNNQPEFPVDHLSPNRFIQYQ